MGEYKSYDSFMGDIFYNAFTMSGIPTKLFGIINIYSIDIYNKVRMGKYYSDMFAIHSGL
jgi:hypothetical protein